MASRRKFIIGVATASTVAIAGCSNSEPESEEELEESQESGSVERSVSEETVELFLDSIADGDLDNYNEAVYDIAEADSMTDVFGTFGTFQEYFEESSDEITINEINIEQITISDIETMIRDLRDVQRDELDEYIQQGEKQVEDVEEQHELSDSVVVYTDYSANSVEIEDYLLVVKEDDSWFVFDSLAY